MPLVGSLTSVLGVAGMFLFGVSILFNVGVGMLWLYLELCGLCLIPLFFSGGACSSLSGLFYYVIFSGVSSSLLLIGLLLPEGVFFLLAGLMMKFGVFPLWGWVYRVCCISGWFVIWGFSTVLKISFILFPLFLVLSTAVSKTLILLCSIGVLLLSFFFWCFSFDWKICWCHMMLSSSGVLVGLSLSGGSVSSLLGLYLVYVFWATGALYYFSVLSENSDTFLGGSSILVYCGLLLSLPVSLAIFYKIVVCSCVFVSGTPLLLSWVVYSFSEQLFLFLFLTGLYSGKFAIDCLSAV